MVEDEEKNKHTDAAVDSLMNVADLVNAAHHIFVEALGNSAPLKPKDELEDVIREVRKNERILELAPDDGEVVPIRSGRNHPWRKMSLKDIPGRTPKKITDDPDHTERNLRWLNCYRPSRYAPVTLGWWYEIKSGVEDDD